MAHYIPPSQLDNQSQRLDQLDTQIIKLYLQSLCSASGNVDTEKNLQVAVENHLGRNIRSTHLPSMYTDHFDIESDGENNFVRAFTKLELCPMHCSVGKMCSGGPICDKLHICKFYLLSNSCQKEKRGKCCTFGHDLKTDHNKELLRQYYLDGLCIEELRIIFGHIKSRCPMTTPQICTFYNGGKGCAKADTGQSCPFLHLCRYYVNESCTFNEACRRSHDPLNQQVQALLMRYGISTRRSPKEVLKDLQSCGVTRDSGRLNNMKRDKSNPNLLGDFGTLAISNSIDSIEICIYHLRGKCHYGKRCRRHHKNSMYQWQLKQQGDISDDAWTDLGQSANFEIEDHFSDVNTDKCYVELSKELALEVDFEKMDGVQINIKTKQKMKTVEIRRLTTESSAVQKIQPLATQWKWYWEHQPNIWILYGEQGQIGYQAIWDSECFESNYQENTIGQMKFATMGHKYVMDFQRMSQKNIGYTTERKVRRRPSLVETAEVERRKKQSATSMVVPAPLKNKTPSYIPQHWSFGTQKRPEEFSDHFQLVDCTLTSSELKKMFYDTMPASAEIVKIERIENGELWMNFVSKREKMAKKGDKVSELQLFHGTDAELIDAISHQGFDFRFSGSRTGNRYGKGSYFAKDAKKADSYTDYKTRNIRGHRRHMFLVRVLPGDYAAGSSSFVRPPPKNPDDPFKLYDSCVDDIQNPKIYVIFTFDQMYPEYIIEYRNMYI